MRYFNYMFLFVISVFIGSYQANAGLFNIDTDTQATDELTITACGGDKDESSGGTSSSD